MLLRTSLLQIFQLPTDRGGDSRCFKIELHSQSPVYRKQVLRLFWRDEGSYLTQFAGLG